MDTQKSIFDEFSLEELTVIEQKIDTGQGEGLFLYELNIISAVLEAVILTKIEERQNKDV